MALSIKKSAWNLLSSTDNASPLQKGMWVEFELSTNSQGEPQWDKNGIIPDNLNKTWRVVLTEPIEFKAETEWTESAGAEIAKKINQIFNSKAIKIFAGNKGSTHAPTDEWTQKTTEKGVPFSAKLKFRIYKKNNVAVETNNYTQNYLDMIKFLTLVCAPRKKYSVANNAIDPLIAAARNSKLFFQNLKSKKSNEEDEKEKNENEKTGTEKRREEEISKQGTVIGYLENYKADKSKNGLFAQLRNNLTSARYNYTLYLKSKIFNKDRADDNCDWYVKSFNWKPSTEMLIIANQPEPLWVDFEVDLETCCSWPKEWIDNITI